jgi:hypothetical protein
LSGLGLNKIHLCQLQHKIYDLIPEFSTQKKHLQRPKLLTPEKSAATSRGGLGPFQGPSSYPQLRWWSLILRGVRSSKIQVTITLNS